MRNYYYLIDKEGSLWHQGTRIDDPRFVSLVLRTMKRLENGQYLVKCQGENCYFEAEDVPYVIQSVEINQEGVVLHFPGNYSENLDPSSLFVSKENILYCKVRQGMFSARFSRKAFFQMVPFIEEDVEKEQFYFKWAGIRYLIR